MFGQYERINQIKDFENNLGSMGFHRNIFVIKTLRKLG